MLISISRYLFTLIIPKVRILRWIRKRTGKSTWRSWASKVFLILDRPWNMSKGVSEKRFSTLYIIFLRHISCISIVFFVVCVYGRFIFVEKTGQVTQLISCVCMWLFGTTWTRQFHFFNRPLNVSNCSIDLSKNESIYVKNLQSLRKYSALRKPWSTNVVVIHEIHKIPTVRLYDMSDNSRGIAASIGKV